MEIYLVDAFTNERFGGNPAGVAVLAQAEPWPDEALMQSLAAELRMSETAFIRRAGATSFALRYFTPTDEVALCGHATVAAFTVLRQRCGLVTGAYQAQTAAGALAIALDGEAVWMDVARPQLRGTLSPDESILFYRALGLALPDGLGQLTPAIVHVGLADLLLPVADQAALMAAQPDREQLIALSKRHNVTGVHLYCLSQSGGVTACCRNFAPLYGIDEEAATGTANGALTAYLHSLGVIGDGQINTFIQGQALGRPGQIYTRAWGDRVQVGGQAHITLTAALC